MLTALSIEASLYIIIGLVGTYIYKFISIFRLFNFWGLNQLNNYKQYLLTNLRWFYKVYIYRDIICICFKPIWIIIAQQYSRTKYYKNYPQSFYLIWWFGQENQYYNKFYLHFTIDSIYLFNIIYNIFKFVALIFPNFSTLLSLSGCICSVSLGFVIPFILYYYTFWDNI